MKFRDRIKELKRVRAGDLIPNPKNWRSHPQAQKDAMLGVIDQVGFADALLVRETPDGLALIDGHLRAEIMPDAEVPVLVLDVTEEEADVILATHDPLAAMAEADTEKLAELMGSIEMDDEAVQAMLEELARESHQGEPQNPEDEWTGMPEFENEDKTSFQSIIVHFENQQVVDEFATLIQQKITAKTRSTWYPQIEIERYADKTYDNES